MERFTCDTRIAAGPGALTALEELRGQRLLIVTDSLHVSDGTVERAAAAAKAPVVEILDRVAPQPTAELVAAGRARIRAAQPDVILALGDGDVMDWAKAMHYFSGGERKLVTVPTVSGSGAEVMPRVVMRHGNQRKPVESPRLAPSLTILDGQLLEELLPGQAAEGGFAGLSLAVEGFTAARGGLFSQTMAAEAFSILYAALPLSFRGDKGMRQRIHTASAMAAVSACSSGQGLCRALAESLEARFPVSMGRLQAVLLPAVIECNGYTTSQTYTRLARAAGLPGGTEQLCRGLCRLRRDLKLPANLAQAGVERSRLWQETEGIVEDTLKNTACRDNPMQVEDFMVRRLLEKVAGR